jgi:hypothetical protein
VSDWRALVMKRQLELAYAMTLDPKERKAAEAMIAEKKGPPPGYDEAFVKGGIFDFSNVRSKVAVGKEVVEKGLRNFLSKTVKGDVVLSFVPGIATAKKLWSLDADKRVLLPVECGVTVGPPGGPASFAGELVIWLQSEPGALESKGNADWRITKIECVKVKTIAEAEPGPRAASERFGAQ